jgi:hypothetical protein
VTPSAIVVRSWNLISLLVNWVEEQPGGEDRSALEHLRRITWH